MHVQYAQTKLILIAINVLLAIPKFQMKYFYLKSFQDF
jgi:hypothetical protein